MRPHIALSVLFLLATAVAAYASAYDDFIEGVSAKNDGRDSLAISKFTEALETAKSQQWSSYIVLWLEMARLCLGKLDPAQLRSDMDQLDDGWPFPVLKLYQGSAAPDDVIADAARGDADMADARKCEAEFYVGDWLLVYNQADKAKKYLQDAVSICPRAYVEYAAARFELGRLSE